MNLPDEILNKVLELLYKLNKKEISKNFRKISDKYIGEKRGESLLNEDNEAIAYSIARMPATFVATVTACKQIVETLELGNKQNIDKLKTAIDVGAGTGAATLAISEIFSLENITCLEREEAMLGLGKILLAESENSVVKYADWRKFDITKKSDISSNKCTADIVITSYMLNEFKEDTVLEIVDRLWDITQALLIIVDPGTPKDYERLMKVKEYLEQKGGQIVAPCTNCKKCELPETDWCNFSCRVERTKLQKDVKDGDVPYEDEKFTYLAISKKDYNIKAENIGRVIRRPIIKSNMVEVKLCSNGEIINKIYTKKDKEMYKKVRKAKVGEIII